MAQIIDNVARRRFELLEEGSLAYADYLVEERYLVISHVEVDSSLQGKGTAGRLMQGLLQDVRARGLKVQPICSYAANYMRRHPETHDLLAQGIRNLAVEAPASSSPSVE